LKVNGNSCRTDALSGSFLASRGALRCGPLDYSWEPSYRF
jgi:hypothetical protein